jgi:LysR family transcriptional activator of nhaA
MVSNATTFLSFSLFFAPAGRPPSFVRPGHHVDHDEIWNEYVDMNYTTAPRMEWVNYHHLLYFWVVAREGGLVPAGKLLRLSHPTLSAQVQALEDHLGEKLFTKVGRRLALTDVGRVVFRYADEIFTLGREMVDTVKGRSTGQPLRLEVGVVDVVPKLVVRQLLKPALSLPEPVKLVCYEDSYEKLLAALALHTLDIVIADAPVPAGSSVRAFNHVLGETWVSFFGARSLATTFKRGFPRSLDGAPVVLPLEHTALRRGLDQWFYRQASSLGWWRSSRTARSSWCLVPMASASSQRRRSSRERCAGSMAYLSSATRRR